MLGNEDERLTWISAAAKGVARSSKAVDLPCADVALSPCATSLAYQQRRTLPAGLKTVLANAQVQVSAALCLLGKLT